jgi:ABC-type uncharacterized transport system substrate-binding protein
MQLPQLVLAPPLRSRKAGNATIPIVFTAVGDPVGAVPRLARPGGNGTDFSMLATE